MDYRKEVIPLRSDVLVEEVKQEGKGLVMIGNTTAPIVGTVIRLGNKESEFSEGDKVLFKKAVCTELEPTLFIISEGDITSKLK